jgi:hypothetical protein
MTTATTSHAPSTASVDILESIRASINVIKGGDPLRQLMIQHGFNPDDGDFMIIPVVHRTLFQGSAPEYVRFSSYSPSVLMIRNPYSPLPMLYGERVTEE